MTLYIRGTTYRGREGFLIYGRLTEAGAFPVRIFVRKRETAEKVREALKREDHDEVDRLIREEGE